MAEPDKKDEEIAEILLDLDNILSDISGGDQNKAEAIAKAASTPILPPAQAAAPPAPIKPPPAAAQPAPISLTPPPAAKPAGAAAPAPAPAPKTAPAPAAPPAPAPVAKAPAPPAPLGSAGIELAPREGMLGSAKPKPAAAPPPKPAAKSLASETKPPMELSFEAEPAAAAPAAATPVPKAEPPAPKPAEPAPPKRAEPPAADLSAKSTRVENVDKPQAAAPAPAPKPAEAAAPAPAAAPSAEPALKDNIPDKTSKEQIRRVAVLHAPQQQEARDKFASFLDNAALTISKKPIYLRKCLVEAVGPQCDAKGVASRAKGAKAVAVLAILEGLPEAKVRELSDACEGAGLTFRLVAPADVQKRSAAVDIMVDLMLLPGEA